VWEFKQIKALFMRIVAPRNLVIQFMHEVRSATRLPIERTQKLKFINDFKRARLNTGV